MLESGTQVKILYRDKSGLRYILEVEVIAEESSGTLIGKIQHIFAEGSGEITGGDILQLKGEIVEFSNTDVIQT